MHDLPDAIVRPCHDFKQVAVGVIEIHSPAAIVLVGFTSALLSRGSPVLEPFITDAGEDTVEVAFTYQESVVLRSNFTVVIVEVEGDAVAETDDEHRPEWDWVWQP